MEGKMRHYFAGGHTARGFFSLYEASLSNLERLFILNGGPGIEKSALMKELSHNWLSKGYDIEHIHCALNHEELEGFIIPALKLGVFDGNVQLITESKVPGVSLQYIDLSTACDHEKIKEYKTQIRQLSEQIEENLQSAYATFNEALHIHDDWEAIFINNLDFSKANQLKDDLNQLFFESKQLSKEATVTHRFLGAATANGPVDYIQNLTEATTQRFFIKGRPGTGKSTLLKGIAKQAEERGFDVEIYHCGFDPFSLDMLILPELGISIFDSTAPHEHFPEREHDQILDVYENLITPGTDEKYAQELASIQQDYDSKMKLATTFLLKAKSLEDELKAYYTQATDLDHTEWARHFIGHEIEEQSSH